MRSALTSRSAWLCSGRAQAGPSASSRAWLPARSSSTRRRRLCSIPTAAASNRALCGRSPETIGHRGGRDPPAIAYAYAPGRGAVHALKLLDSYRGVIQCDGYAAYKNVAANSPDGRIVLAFCWAHLRRRFFDQAKAPLRSPTKRSNGSPCSMRSRRRSGA